MNNSVKEFNVSFSLKYSKRKTLSIAVLPDLSVLVTAPHGTDLVFIEEKVKKRETWINKQLNLFREQQKLITDRRYISGESYSFLGKQYRLKLHKLETIVKKSERCLLKTRTEFHIYSDDLSVAVVKEILENWYRKQAERYFSRLLNISFKKFLRHYVNSVRDFNSNLSFKEAGLVSLKSVAFPKLVVRKMKTRWGSLSKKTNLTLNLDLIKATPECIEYVMFHELCHLVYFNHSREFTALLNKILPEANRLKEKLDSL